MIERWGHASPNALQSTNAVALRSVAGDTHAQSHAARPDRFAGGSHDSKVARVPQDVAIHLTVAQGLTVQKHLILAQLVREYVALQAHFAKRNATGKKSDPKADARLELLPHT